MKLKQLTIIGFKSFAEKVVLDFDCEISAIVGPNGCGKSNIVDAFRWALGEQSAKSLRGDKMEDVLFAGSEKKKPFHFAEVSIVFSEIEGTVDLPFEELVVTRRLHRSGESEYFINKRPVRLKDVHDLFLGTGIGKNAFSVFEQGKLDQVIHFSPLERRHIFEDAAGISRFLLRKKETQKKLLQTTENFQRVKVMHQEMEKNTRVLKKQALLAKTYQENQEKLKQLECSLLVWQWKKITTQIKEAQTALHALDRQITMQSSDLQESEKILKKAKHELSQQEVVVQTQQETIFQLQTESRIFETESLQQQERLKDLKLRAQTFVDQITELKKKREETTEKQAAYRQQLQELNQKKEQLEKSTQEKKVEFEKYEKEWIHQRLLQREEQRKHVKSIQEENTLKNQLSEAQRNKEAHIKKRARLEEELNKKEKMDQELEQTVLKHKTNVSDLSNQIAGLKRELLESEQRIQQTQKECIQEQEKIELFSRKIAEISARKNALEKIKEELDGVSNGTKILLQEAKHPESPLFGKIRLLFELLRPHKGMETALAAALAPYVHTLIVETTSDLKLVVTYAAERNIFDFSLLACDQLEFQDKEVAWTESSPFARHFLASLPCPLKEISSFTEKENVSTNGYFVDAKRVLFCHSTHKKEHNPFLRESELNILADQLKKMRVECEAVTHLLTEKKEALKKQEIQRQVLSEMHRKKEMHHIQENFVLQKILTDSSNLKEELSAIRNECALVKEDPKEIKILESLAAFYQTKQAEVASLAEILSERERDLDQGEEVLQKAKEAYQHEHTLLQHHENEKLQLEQALSFFTTSFSNDQTQEKQFIREIEKTEQVIDQLQNQLEASKGKKQEALAKRETLQKMCLIEKEKCAEMRKECSAFEQKLKDAHSPLAKLEKEKNRLQLLLAHDSSSQMEYEKQLANGFGCSLENLDNYAPVYPNVHEMEEEKRRLQRTLEEAGAVNFAAIESYQLEEERFQEINRQLADLEAAVHDSEEMIRKLDSESRKQFKQTFERIRQQFRKNFSILFQGGEADLKFTESPDVLEAGIEIYVKPPGKQMRIITLLSGGEKCLTALALLFSFFEVRPAPVCILDEVDAPLDETNVGRFTALLNQFTSTTQFIIVTHNKKTMSIADVLIGVTMEEKGISKLISLAFEKTCKSAVPARNI